MDLPLDSPLQAMLLRHLAAHLPPHLLDLPLDLLFADGSEAQLAMVAALGGPLAHAAQLQQLQQQVLQLQCELMVHQQRRQEGGAGGG